MSKPTYSKDDLRKISDEYLERKVMEHYRIHRLVNSNNQMLNYEVLANDNLFPHPPVHYRIVYSIKSFIGVKKDLNPIVGTEHIVELKIPKIFPEQPVDARLLTDTWHPNTKPISEGGYICTNSNNFGGLFQIDELIVRIGEILQYKNYMAEDRKPWPENDRAAKWIREFAEPNGIVNIKENNFVDDYDWQQFFDQGYPAENHPDADTDQVEDKDDIIFEDSTFGEGKEEDSHPIGNLKNQEADSLPKGKTKSPESEEDEKGESGIVFL